MIKLIISFLFCTSLFATDGIEIFKEVKEEQPIVSNNTNEEVIVESTLDEMQYVNLDDKGNTDTFGNEPYDDSIIWKAVRQNQKNISDIKNANNEILNILKRNNKDWNETTLPDGTKVRTNANGDVEVFNPKTGKWESIDKLSKEDREKLLNKMVNAGVISEAEKTMIQEKIDKDWNETTLPDGTKVRTNANGDVEVFNPKTGKWESIDKLSKEDREKLLNKMVNAGVISEAEKTMIQEKIDKDWNETTLPDGTKVRTNANGDVEVFNPKTGKWESIDKLSKEDREKLLNKMVNAGVISEAEKTMIQEKIDKDWNETTLPDGTKVRTNANGDVEVFNPKTGKWESIDKLSKEDREKLLNKMVNAGVISEAEKTMIQEKIDRDWNETTLPDGTKVRTNANGDVEVFNPKTGKWESIDKLSKEDREKLLNKMVNAGVISEAEKTMIQEKIEEFQSGDWADFDEGNNSNSNTHKNGSNSSKKDDGSKKTKPKGYYDEDGNYKEYKPNDKNSNDSEEEKESSIVTLNDKFKNKYDTKIDTDKINIEKAASVMNYMSKIEKANQKSSKSERIVKADTFPEFNALLAQNKKELEDEANKKEAEKEIKVIASCYLNVQKDIISSVESMETYCSSQKLGTFVLLSELKSEIKDSLPTLKAEAKELSFSIDGYINPKNYVVKESLTLNAYTSNQNIATKVNMRRFEKFISKSGKSTYELSKAGVNKYLEAKSASLEETSTTTDSTNGDKTVNSNSKTPKIMDYLTPTGIQIALALVGHGMELLYEDSPIIYIVDKGTRFKVYLTLTTDSTNKKD